ncbi:NAD(P)/FAD-dependent oxidoreductase [Candidimonas nitroreducens]|uniref:FAD-dependent oxidoreductase n=1 Tax=Candidimonas nitroreducens TaxID=683354 RepID=A0A225MW38_9BURK|nr:FAD-dependent oxidoreductase [Candidimonas nitroreducens]OWT65478.1 FAD-dependent oxidoreductase [Candidimonas nitroreducens]
MQAHAHRVVIVGGGAGGLELAAKLGGRFGPRCVTLVDLAAFHIWKPSLHEVAAGTLDIHREGLSYFMLGKSRGFQFVRGEMLGADLQARSIRLGAVRDAQGEELYPARDLAYDTLVLAVGSKSNFFGTPGASQFALAIDSTAQAEKFRLRLLRELAHAQGSSRGLNIAIVGAGATGVELAAELAQSCADVVSYGLADFDPARDLHITLLEGAPRILSALPEKISTAAHNLLTERGIQVRTGVRIAAVRADGLSDSEGRDYPADLCVWAAGIEAPAFLSGLGLRSNARNQLVVDAALRTSDASVYALGDCIELAWGEGRFVPARAQAAHQQADFLLQELSARIRGAALPQGGRAFRYKDYGSLVSLGHSRVVGNLMGVLTGKGLFIEGLFARFMYMSLHLMHHFALLGGLRTAMLAIGRLLIKRGAPRVKLH